MFAHPILLVLFSALWHYGSMASLYEYGYDEFRFFVLCFYIEIVFLTTYVHVFQSINGVHFSLTL